MTLNFHGKKEASNKSSETSDSNFEEMRKKSHVAQGFDVRGLLG